MLVETLPESLETLKNLIQNSIDTDEKISAGRIKEFVEQAEIRAEDLLAFEDFGHPAENGYGRKMIYDGGKFEIMAMSWSPGDHSSIHNHGYTQWGVVKVFGNAQHYIYQNKNGVLSFSKKEILTAGAITKVSNALIHQMGNPSTERYMTLHIYGCNHKESGVTADAKNYELEFERVNHTTGGAFFNLPKDKIYEFEPCPIPTDDVFINYSKLLLDYYQRQEQTSKIIELKNVLLEKLQKRIG